LIVVRDWTEGFNDFVEATNDVPNYSTNFHVRDVTTLIVNEKYVVIDTFDRS